MNSGRQRPYDRKSNYFIYFVSMYHFSSNVIHLKSKDLASLRFFEQSRSITCFLHLAHYTLVISSVQGQYDELFYLFWLQTNKFAFKLFVVYYVIKTDIT